MTLPPAWTSPAAPDQGWLWLQASLVVPVIQGGTQPPVLLPVTCQLAPLDLASNHTLDVTGSYLDHAGNMRSVVASLRLPLGDFCQLVAPVHTAACKVTLTTNLPPLPLTSLFAAVVNNQEVQCACWLPAPGWIHLTCCRIHARAEPLERTTSPQLIWASLLPYRPQRQGQEQAMLQM